MGEQIYIIVQFARQPFIAMNLSLFGEAISRAYSCQPETPSAITQVLPHPNFVLHTTKNAENAFF
jgi:hypothetical protein